MIFKFMLAMALPLGFTLSTSGQNAPAQLSKPDPGKNIQKAELSCGQCKFKMKGKGCSLAIKIDGKTYFVDGATIDEFGNAHSKNGFCKAVRKAEVQGKIEGDRFRLTYVKLL